MRTAAIFSAISPGGRAASTERAANARPIISFTMRSWSIASFGNVPTSVPSRRTMTRSATRSTSCRRCEMKMTLIPSAFSEDMTASSFSVSASGRLEVGSSRMTRRALMDNALAISTICCCASDSDATGVSGEKLAPTRFKRGVTISRRRVRSTSFRAPPRNGSRPRKILAATSRLSNRLSS